MPWNIIRHATQQALVDTLSRSIADDLDRALLLANRATLVLAGGRTSPPVFRKLAAQSRNWSRVTVAPSDERWVPEGHPDHNLTQMRAAFAGADAIRWLPLVPPDAAGPVDAAFAETNLAAHPEVFDLAMVGMGVDGHFASLFPGATTLSTGLDLHQTRNTIDILPDPMPAAGPHPRISITLSRLLRSDRLLLVITGADKLAVLERAQGGETSLPVASLLATHHPAGEVHWSP